MIEGKDVVKIEKEVAKIRNLPNLLNLHNFMFDDHNLLNLRHPVLEFHSHLHDLLNLLLTHHHLSLDLNSYSTCAPTYYITHLLDRLRILVHLHNFLDLIRYLPALHNLLNLKLGQV